jgi:hypothetical protein
MSEKLFALLLRLYPARFRDEYADEAMQLFHDRLRDERGALPRLRLWFDLLVDLAFSLPREHSRVPRTLAPAPMQMPAGVPSFHMLEEQPPRPGSFVSGTILALVALSVFVFLLNHGGTYRLRASSFEGLTSEAGYPAESQGPARRGTSAEFNLDAAERRRVIAAVIANLKEFDGRPGEERRLSELLSTHEKQGDYDGITSGNVFSAELNEQMRDVTHDTEPMVVFRSQRASESSTGNHLQQRIPGTFHRIDEHFDILIP